jgi:hypothetical protein
MKITSISLAGLVAISAMFSTTLHAETEITGTPAELIQHLSSLPGVVLLTGEGEVKAPSDRALISLAVVTENRSLQEASRANQDIRARMIRTLGEQGIPAERIQASTFSSTPKYGVFGDKAKSYRVENVVKITAQDEREFQLIAGLVDGRDEVRYHSVNFEHSDKESLKKQALEQAIDKTLEKKRLYEEKLGVTLTAKGIVESPTLSNLPATDRRMYAGLESNRAMGFCSTPYSPGSNAKLMDIHADLPSSFAEVIYHSEVRVEFLVEIR